jgi:hypothetical protein
MNIAPLLNQAAVREYALTLAKTQRNGRFTRISASFLTRLNAKLKVSIEHEVHSHPGVGHTLK